MGEFWKTYFLDSGQRMSPRQIKKVMKLEKDIEDCDISINGLEEIIRRNSEEIDHIKKGGGKRPRNIDFKVEIDF